MIQTVVKRDGRIVGYNEEKVKAAIRKAMLQTEKGEDESLIMRIVDRITARGRENMEVEQIQDMGVDIARVTLHVGLGTFRPVKVDEITDHHMHSEFFIIDEEAAEKINRAKDSGHRVICVGTTSCRTIESAADETGHLKACSGWTDIFIYPGYRFKFVDELLTNFHTPESTLLMLVSALAGRENILKAYGHAVEEKYHFYSYGDAMFIRSHSL